MSEVTLDRVLEFNAELLRLAATGLPLDLGFAARGRSLEIELSEVIDRLKVDIGRGLSLDKAIETAPFIPRAYRIALETWLRCDRSMTALDGPAASADAQLELQANVRAALVQPLIALFLMYLGFVYLCLVTAPKLEAIYAQQFETPGKSLSFLVWAREWMPIWLPLVPLALFSILVWLSFRAQRMKYGWLPGCSKYVEAVQKASYAEHLASLLEGQRSMAEALSIVGQPPSKTVQAASMQTALENLVRTTRAGQPVAPDDPALQPLPPILRWALMSGADSSSKFLRLAASIYRHSAERHMAYWQAWLPALAIVILGGSVVFGYSLSLFLPLVDLLQDLATVKGI